MRLLSDEQNTQPTLKTDVIPATLHDFAEEVYNDKLYSLYTLRTAIENAVIKVSVIATDLIRHTDKNNEKGYWIGVGINAELLDTAKVYIGYGDPVDTDLGAQVELTQEETSEGKIYKTFFFDVEKARKTSNKAYIVADLEGIHYHYSIDVSEVSLKVAEEDIGTPLWSAVSTDDLINKYLFGIDLSDANGNPLPKSLFMHYLNSAIEYMQSLLDITITDTTFTERHDYYRNDYRNWGFIQLDHNPVKEVKSIKLMYGSQPSVNIPLDWVQLDKLSGQITLFPSAGSANSLIIGQTGMLFGFQSQWDYAPQLWEVEYVAGIDEKDRSMPLQLLMEAVYKRASTGILNVWGDLIIGAGIASQSVSIDGLSQSIGTTQSAMFGGASARVENYTKDLKEQILPALRQKFGGIRLVVI